MVVTREFTEFGREAPSTSSHTHRRPNTDSFEGSLSLSLFLSLALPPFNYFFYLNWRVKFFYEFYLYSSLVCVCYFHPYMFYKVNVCCERWKNVIFISYFSRLSLSLFLSLSLSLSLSIVFRVELYTRLGLSFYLFGK